MPHAPQEIRTYFITTVTASRRRLFQIDTNANLLIEILQTHRAKPTFALHAFVLMPDHLHLLLTPAPQVSLEKAMQLIKGTFSFRLKSNADVWERSYDSRRIADAVSYTAHRTYIHRNPIRANRASTPAAYPHSSASHPDLVDPAPTHFRV